MRRGLSRCGVLFMLLVCWRPDASEAQVGGTLSGYVQDQAGGAIPGATVTAELEGQKLVPTTATNVSGFFDLQALPRGKYLVKVEMSGFATQVQKDVEVAAGANVRNDFTLRVGGLAEELVVAARSSMVETRNATQSNLIDDQRVQDLPMNGRNVVALAGTYAGVTAIRASQDTSDGRQGPVMSVNGGNQNHNLFTLDGSVFTHFNQTTGFNPPPPDAVQEIRIQTHNFSAEYGHTAGSQVSIVTKAGHQRVPRHRLGVPSQLGAQRAQLLPDAEAGAEAEPGRSERGRRRHPQQDVLVRIVPAAVGSRRGGLEPDGRADRCAARRQLHRAQHAAEKSRQPDYQRAVHRQHRRAVRLRQRDPAGLHQPGRDRTASGACARVGDGDGRQPRAGAARPRGLHGARGLPFLGRQPSECAFLRRPERQLRPGRAT